MFSCSNSQIKKKKIFLIWNSVVQPTTPDWTHGKQNQCGHKTVMNMQIIYQCHILQRMHRR
jgi:hypothetical protein